MTEPTVTTPTVPKTPGAPTEARAGTPYHMDGLSPHTLARLGLVRLATRYGTPAYIYELADVRRAHRDLRESLPEPSVLHYSLKANPHPRLVAELATLGCHAEVSSIGEVDIALVAGIRAEHVQVTGPGKTDELIRHALDRAVTRFSVDSPDDMARVGKLAASRGLQADCLLRINADTTATGMGLTMTGVASAFGADASWVARSPDEFYGYDGTRLVGLHFYAGANLTDQQTLLDQFDTSISLAARLSALLPGVTEVNLGGGFGTAYARAGDRPNYPNLIAGLTRLLDAHLPGWRSQHPRVGFESGRYLVGDCGTLLCRIMDVKQSRGKTFVVLDTGIHHLGGMSGLRRLVPVLPTLEPLSGDTSGRVVACTIVGPLCAPLDTFARDVPLANPQPGQLAAVPNVGAYGLTASLVAFLSHPAPVEIVTDKADVVSVTRLSLERVNCAHITAEARMSAQAGRITAADPISVAELASAAQPALGQPISERENGFDDQ